MNLPGIIVIEKNIPERNYSIKHFLYTYNNLSSQEEESKIGLSINPL